MTKPTPPTCEGCEHLETRQHQVIHDTPSHYCSHWELLPIDSHEPAGDEAWIGFLLTRPEWCPLIY